MNKTMARVCSVAVIVLLGAALFSASAATKRTAPFVSGAVVPTACAGGASLSGWYGFMVGGGEHTGGGKYLSGALNFDGNCNLTGNNISGGTNGNYVTTSASGTYGQNADGTFTITMNLVGLTAAQTYVVGVTESGNKARGIESDNTATATIDIQSQLTSLTQGYTTANLTGTYAAYCSGSGVDVNYVTFDGKGNLTGVNPYDIGGSQGNSPYSGTYSVNTDGTFSGSLTGSYSQYSFNGVIDNGVNEIEYIYNQSGNPVDSCVGKQSTTTNLLGYYGMVVGGTATPGGGGTYLSGSIYFNGTGGLSGTNVNGGLNGQYGNTSVTGSYVANSDNTVTITMNLANVTTPLTFIVGVSESGYEAVGIETDGSAVATIDLQNQIWPSNLPYSTASLNGTYAASCSGAEVDLNFVTFDGAGNLSGIDPYDNGNFGSSPYTGTYTVNGDGTFFGGFAGSYANYTMTGVIDNGIGEIEYTYNYAGTGGVVQCVGESTYGPVGTAPVAASPTFSPAPGAYGPAQSVTLSDTTPGAVIYYTTNGVTPTVESPVYSSPIQVSSTTTIQAIAVATNYNNSAISGGTYFLGVALPTAATPTFSPAPGTYSSPQTVTLSDTTTGAVIHCTTNGTTPTANSPVCTSLTVSATTTINAIAVATNYNNSAVASGTYTITLPTAATPTFSPVPGTYSSAQTVTLSDATSGAVIHCTTDGSTPTASSPVCTSLTINVTTTINAIDVATNYNNSAVASGTYTIVLPAATPTFSPAPGTYSAPQTVTLSDATSGAVIHCTTDGSTPTASSAVCTTLTVSTTTTVNAIAVATGYGNSAVATGTYTITGGGGGGIVNLSTYFNVYGIATTGNTPKHGGFDNDGYAYNSSTLGTTATYQNLTFTLGAANALDALTAQTVLLPAGQFNQLFLLGAGVNGVQTNQTIVVTYTDGSTSSLLQSFSDWAFSQGYPGETTVLAASNRIGPNGQLASPAVNVYGYTVSLTSGKTAYSVKLPFNRNVVFLAMGLGTATPTAATPTFSPAPGTYSSAQSVTLSDTTAGAVIYYTTDGTKPTASSAKYTSPIPVNVTMTIEAMAVANGYLNSAVATGVYTLNGTPIVPYIQVNNGFWQQTASVTVALGSSVNLGPQPLYAGSWNWTGPNGYTSTSRQINNIPLASGTNTYVATYTNPSGVKSTQTFTITATGSVITPYIQVNGGAWQQTYSVTVSSNSATVNFGPQPLSGGSWLWLGPNGYTSTSRQINAVPLPYTGANIYWVTYTNKSGVPILGTFTVNVQ